MNCGGCGAELLLGSASCQRCGASALDATSSPGPRIPPPLISTPGEPPPPPPGAPRAKRSARARVAKPAKAVKERGGWIGCLILLVVVGSIVGPFVYGGWRVVGAIRDSLDASDGPDVVEVDAGRLVIGEPTNGRMADDQRVLYRFTGEGRSYLISVDARSDGFDPTVRVRGADGTELGFNDDGPDAGLNSRLDVVVAGGETVTVEVEELQGDPGTFTIQVR